MRAALGVDPSKPRPPKVAYSPQEKSAISSPGVAHEIQTGSIDPQKLQSLIPDSALLRGQPKFDEALDESFDLTGLTKDLRSVRGPSLEEAFANSQKKNQKLAMEVQREEQSHHQSNGDLLDTKMLQDSDPLSAKLDKARRDSLLLTDLRHSVDVEHQSPDLQDQSQRSEDLKKSLDLEAEQSSRSQGLEDKSDLAQEDSRSPHAEELHDHDSDKGLNVTKEMENELMALDNLVEKPTMSEDELIELERDPHSASESQHHSIRLDETQSAKQLSEKSLDDSSPRLETQSLRHADLEDQSEQLLSEKSRSHVDQDALQHGAQRGELREEVPLASEIKPGSGELIKKTMVASGHGNLKDIFQEHPDLSVGDELALMKEDPQLQGLGLAGDLSPGDELDLIEQKLASGELQHKPELRRKVEQMVKAQKELVRAVPVRKSPNTGVVQYKKFKRKRLTQAYQTMKNGELPKGSVGHSAKTTSQGHLAGAVPDGKRKFNRGQYNKFVGAEKRHESRPFSRAGAGAVGMIRRAERVRLDKLARGRRGRALGKFLRV